MITGVSMLLVKKSPLFYVNIKDNIKTQESQFSNFKNSAKNKFANVFNYLRQLCS